MKASDTLPTIHPSFSYHRATVYRNISEKYRKLIDPKMHSTVRVVYVLLNSVFPQTAATAAHPSITLLKINKQSIELRAQENNEYLSRRAKDLPRSWMNRPYFGTIELYGMLPSVPGRMLKLHQAYNFITFAIRCAAELVSERPTGGTCYLANGSIARYCTAWKTDGTVHIV